MFTVPSICYFPPPGNLHGIFSHLFTVYLTIYITSIGFTVYLLTTPHYTHACEQKLHNSRDFVVIFLFADVFQVTHRCHLLNEGMNKLTFWPCFPPFPYTYSMHQPNKAVVPNIPCSLHFHYFALVVLRKPSGPCSNVTSLLLHAIST